MRVVQVLMAAGGFSDELLDRLRAVSPRLRITRATPTAADADADQAWDTVEVLYTIDRLTRRRDCAGCSSIRPAPSR